MSTRARSRLRHLALLLVAALVLTACGGTGDDVEADPRQALQDAFAALADYEGFELRLHLDADEAALARAMGVDDIGAAEARMLARSAVLVRATGDGDDGAVELVMSVDGDDVVELRILPDLNVYVRADLEALVELSDDPETGDLESFVADAEMFGFGDVAAALRAGDWIHLTGLQQMMAMFEGMAGPPADDDVDEEEAERLAEELAGAAERFLASDVEVAYIGSEDAGERVRATASGDALRDFAVEVTGIVAASGLAGDMDGLDLRRELEQELDVPDDLTMSVDFWIADGRLQQLALDLAELADEDVGGEVLLVLRIAEFTGTLDAPADATQIDLFGLLGGFLGGGMGLMPDGEDPFAELDDEVDLGLDEGDLEGMPECITEEELEELESFLGEEARAEFDEMIEAGFLELC